jgi:hypothetical protein
MSTAIRATWYDLVPEVDRQAHAVWVHDDYLPGLKSLPGVAWVAHYEISTDPSLFTQDLRDLEATMSFRPEMHPELGLATQFIVLVGAAEVGTLTSSALREAATVLEREHGPHPAVSGTRTMILSEILHANGPAYGEEHSIGAPSPAIQFGTYRFRGEGLKTDAGIRYYSEYKLAGFAATPGCVRMRVFACVSGFADLSVMYEFSSLDARREGYLKLERKTVGPGIPPVVDELLSRIEHTPGSAYVASRLWPDE